MCYTVIAFLAIMSMYITIGVRHRYIVTTDDLKIIILLMNHMVLNFNKLEDCFSCSNPL